MAKPKAKAKPKAAKAKPRAKKAAARAKARPAKAKAKAKAKARPVKKAKAKPKAAKPRPAAAPTTTAPDAAPTIAADVMAAHDAATEAGTDATDAAPSPARDPIATAIAGEVSELYELAAAIEDDGERDVTLYRWLAIAADHGSGDADDAIDDMLETSSLRYDDDHGAQGDIHFELAVAYLTGSEGLARNLDHGRAHLVQARRCDYPEQIQDGPRFLAEARAKLDAEALAVFDAVYNGQPLAEGGGGEEADDDDDDEDYG